MSSAAAIGGDANAPEILATRCLECHSGAEPKGGLNLTSLESARNGGEHGAALVPGDPGASLLWKQVDAGEMPPEKSGTLTSEEKELVRKWILAGAPYPDGGMDPFAVTTASRAGYDWWSLQPVRRPEVPTVSPDHWSRGAIDRFVLAMLRHHGLDPSPEAEPRALVRRLFFDLTGLPPDPGQVDAFVANPSDDAYRQLVDDLLASPHYGERWGRHWLDLARFGESDGFERNNVRENQWHFRDWVIRALNADMPYDRFAKMQIAGDLLEPGRSGLAAAAFLTAGVHNTVVGGSEFMKRTARQDELEEIAGTVGQTFVGLTMNCARCHDHKFDPVTQTEYYRFVAALSGVGHGERDYRDPEAEARMELLGADIGALEKRLAALEAPVIAQVLERRKQAGAVRPEPPAALYTWAFDTGLADTSGAVAGTAIGTPRLEGGAVVFDDGSSYVETAPLPVTIRAKTLEAVVQLADLDQRGGAAISLQDKEGDAFDAIVFGEREARRWMAGSDGFTRSQEFGGPEETAAAQQPVHVAIVFHEDGRIDRYRNGKHYGESYRTGVRTFTANESVIRFGIRHLPAGANKHLKGKLFSARLYDRALSGDEVAAAAGTDSAHVSEQEIVAGLDDTARAGREGLLAERDSLRTQLAAIEATTRGKVYTVAASQTPGVTRVLVRGNAMEEGEVVAPGTTRAVRGLEADFGLAPDAADADRRRHLADWITSPRNPLFARVIVNRLWHYHFGTGIVDTPNDFGFNGGRPSHPGLVDWLASEIAANGWSLKHMHRLIVNSATYRQGSRPNDAGMAKDAGNRLLWRKSPQRLDAESLRDAMLAVSGRLNPEQFGPGFRDVKIAYVDGTTYFTPFDEENAAFNRRTIYRFSPRGGRSAILDTFDCPDPATTAPRRTVTTTPLQALALLNNAFALRIGGHFANRFTRAGGTDGDVAAVAAQVERAYRLAFGRTPDAEELRLASNLVAHHGPHALARVLFNSNEFVVIE